MSGYRKSVSVQALLLSFGYIPDIFGYNNTGGPVHMDSLFIWQAESEKEIIDMDVREERI